MLKLSNYTILDFDDLSNICSNNVPDYLNPACGDALFGLKSVSFCGTSQ